MYKTAIIVALNNEYALTENFFTNLLPMLPSDFQLVAVIDGILDKNTYTFLDSIKQKHQNIIIHALKENVGFSKANNIAVNLSNAEYLLFLNSDTFPIGKSLQTLVNYMEENKDVGVAQGMIVSPQNNKVQSTGHIFSFYRTTHAFDGRNIDDPIVNQIVERQALASGFYITRRELFERFGGFDEIYYNAWEGLEYSLKVHCSGLKCMYIPTARAYHVRGSGRNRIFRNEQYQTAYFWSKWAGYIKMDITNIYNLQLDSFQTNNQYMAINASSYRDHIWDILLEKVNIQYTRFYNVSLSTVNNRVSFEDSIPNSIVSAQNPILFVADHFSTITNNYRFFEFRNIQNDIIFDLHGNVIYPQKYHQTRGSK